MSGGFVRAEVLLPSDPKWTGVLEQVEHDFYHLPRYAETCAKPSNAEAMAFHIEEEGNHLFLPMIARPLPDFGDQGLQAWRDASSPYGYPGPIIAGPERGGPNKPGFATRAVRALLERMQEMAILTAFVRFHPLLDPPLEPFSATGELVLHGRTVSIDLRLPAEQIWRETRRNHRSQIAQLRESGAIVERDSAWTHFDEFLHAYQATMDRVGAQQSYYFDRSYYEGLRAALGDRAHLFIMRFGDRTAAAAIITEVCGIVQYHLAATFSDFVKQHPQQLMFHEVCLWAKERGNRVLHLGGGLGGQEDDLFHFKAGFSPLRHPFHTWRARSDATLYKRVVSLWEQKMRPDSVDPVFFPPYRQLYSCCRV